ncbi:hypothetical protein C8Q80DRAFT_1212220 [Daedaleopsis nitida]|nr:hypothetical protein C8Q80DRAFT_1212220 [Daedaleopsis nitida]
MIGAFALTGLRAQLGSCMPHTHMSSSLSLAPPRAYPLTSPSIGGSPTMPSPLPTDVSATYNLLGQYSDREGDPRTSHSLGQVTHSEEHHEVWKKVSQTHEDLVASRLKEKVNPDKRLSTMRENREKLDGASKALWNANSPSTSVQGISNNTTTFFDKTPALLKTLEKVGEIHPFAAVAVLAFKAVYELELKRRENDKKILAVYGEMRDMMGALSQLRTIKSEDEVGPDGVSIKARMESLVDDTAADIKKCANTCDTYLKKKVVVKILTGTKWEHLLSKIAGHFHKRRKEFEFALAIHTGLGVDKANAKLDELGETTRRIQEKMDTMVEFFKTAATPEQKEIAARVQEKGGSQAVVENDRSLRELVDLYRGTDGTADISGARVRRDVGFDVDDLRLEIREDVEVAVARNAETFARKFEMQRKIIVDELSRVVHREGDRVIDAITAGPHDRIIDPDLHAIWKEMGWRGSTKARHFVLALRDYFRERMEEQKRNDRLEAPRIQQHDEWALDWINVTRLQPIVEAFDDDASNFITVTEANELTTARPKDWSLLHWLAYWAIGWQYTATLYRDKINHLFAKMFALKAHIHPAVRSSVDTYLHTVWTGISELTTAIDAYYPSEALREKFQSYIDDEERRLREGLEAVRYDIDAMDTLVLVTGPGRIEKYVFPMLYLLLKKDYEVMRIARKKVINKDELWDAADTIEWVLHAVHFRYKDLQDIFRQQKLDPRQQFRTFACGLFEHWRNSDGLWNRNVEFPDHVYNDDEEAQEVIAGDLLNYALDSDDLFDPSGYDAPPFLATGLDMASQWPMRAILGSWTGFLSKGDIYPCQPMMSLHIHATDATRFEASSRTSNGTSFTLSGRHQVDAEGVGYFAFTVKYAARFDPLYFRGRIYDNGTTLTGVWGSSPNGLVDDSMDRSEDSDSQSTLVPYAVADRFIFKRLPASLMTCRPDPVEFQMNKARTLWKYALTAVQEIVGMHLFTWNYFKRRRDNRKRYIELLIRLNYADLNEEEQWELARIRQTLTAADARLYETRYDYELRTTPIHLDITCDHCESTIIGPRIVCLDCDTPRTLNLCDDARCRDSPIDTEKRTDLPALHQPDHAVFKVRTMMHLREFGKMDRAARAALKKARATFNDIAELLEDEQSAVHGQAPEVPRHSRTAKIVQARLSCAVCKQRVSKPCWYCVVCQDDVFICPACDAKGPLTVVTHHKLHPLVRVQDPSSSGPPSVEHQLALLDARLAGIEHRFEGMDARLGGLDGRFGALEARVGSMDEKLGRIERILDEMWTRSRKLASSRRAQSVNMHSHLSAGE